MILFDLTGNEAHPAYKSLEIANGDRTIDFLRSAVAASLEVGRPFLSQTLIKALNFHAIACLHTSAGAYRPCPVTVGGYRPPEHYNVPDLMDDFVNMVNRMWQTTDEVVLSAYVLWKLNFIHPFINGNGRTARAASYFVLCVKSGGWLPGSPILPELLKTNRPEYVSALQKADASIASGTLDLSDLHALMSRLLAEQIDSSAQPPGPSHPVT